MSKPTNAARNPRAEAAALTGRNVRVLEPSPPAVTVEPWFADDPTALEGDLDAVTPTSAGAATWDDLVNADAALADYARTHWLGNHKPLAPVPDDYQSSRDDFHRLAYGVISNARKAATGKFGLRYTHGGFGTPFFGADQQVRVEGTELVVQRAGAVSRRPITTLAEAASFAGTVADETQAEHDTIALGDLDRPLDVRADVGAFLGDWFGFATSVLEEARLLGAAPDDDVSRVQIWPGHFDPAMEIGSLEAGRRATYGASPGDATHPEPYFYVAAWGDIDRANSYWNDKNFNGGALSYAELQSTSDPKATALDFFGRGYNLLHGVTD